MTEPIAFDTGPGRLVQGDLWKGDDKNKDGTQRVFKTGSNAGQPCAQFYVGIAIPKLDQTQLRHLKINLS